MKKILFAFVFLFAFYGYAHSNDGVKDTPPSHQSNALIDLFNDWSQKQQRTLEENDSTGLDPTAISDYQIFRDELEEVLADDGYDLPPFDPYPPIGDPLPPMDPYSDPGEVIASSAEACFGAIAAADIAIMAATRTCRRGPSVPCAYASAGALSLMGVAVLTCEFYLRTFDQME